jgi:hypothetical protein
MKIARNSGLSTVTLMACIAAAPASAGCRASALMMKFEKAKNAPAISAAPSATTSVRMSIQFIEHSRKRLIVDEDTYRR